MDLIEKNFVNNKKSLLKRQKFGFVLNGPKKDLCTTSYIVEGKYISFLIAETSGIYGTMYEAEISVNQNVGKHHTSDDTDQYGFFRGYGGTIDYDNDIFTDGKYETSKFLNEIEKFCETGLHDNHEDWKTQIGLGKDIAKKVFGKEIFEWFEMDCNADKYYFVSYHESKIIIELSKQEFEAICNELENLSKFLFK